MSEPNFRGLVEDIGDAAWQPEFDTVRGRAGSLRTRRQLVVGGGALAALAVVGAAGYAVSRPDAAPKHGPADPPPPMKARVFWIGAGSPDHLYALVRPSDGRFRALMASDNGGRTWRERTSYAALPPSDMVPELVVLGPRFLSLTVPFGVGWPVKGPEGEARKISLDGGATWRDARSSRTPVERVAADALVIGCPMGDECVPHTADPATGVFAPLGTLPTLEPFELVDKAPPAAGLWAAGFEPVTRLPAVAVSRDRGRTWTVSVLPGEAPPPVDREYVRAYLPEVATSDGRTVYATLTTEGAPPRVLRSTDGAATWQRNTPVGLPVVTPLSYVTADGAHVMLVQENDTYAFWASPDGRGYARMTAPGAPPKFGVPPVVVDQRCYLTHDDQAVYRSGDGRAWQRLNV